MKKIISLFVTLVLLLVLTAPASAHNVMIFPADNQPDSVNITADHFYFNVGDSTNLYLYIIHGPDGGYAEIAPNFNITMTLIAPDGTITPVTATRSDGNVTYDKGNGTMVTANWYFGNVTLNQEGVYYIMGTQRGYDENGTLTRERFSFSPLYVGNSTKGWDNIQTYGQAAGANVTVSPTADPKNIQVNSSLTFKISGDLNWFLNEKEDPVPVKNPFPIVAEAYVPPTQVASKGPGTDINSHVDSNMTHTFAFDMGEAWAIVAVNQEEGEDRDNFQSVFVLPVQTSADDAGEKTTPGLGFLGIAACIGIAGVLVLRKKQS
ncbi:LPXTG cell wall anchor domain-containing protein [Methanolapillus millepedarum]|uniref:DUF4198 domain-containing protein n=1 Tax=Methanolapillus millepedarum TaxID=3028296 RepID=A0AA96ZVD1_9EURY|nr:hypothetical protein MsAc7_08420 [Methanosarcinaceae archaeon Ac7]